MICFPRLAIADKRCDVFLTRASLLVWEPSQWKTDNNLRTHQLCEMRLISESIGNSPTHGIAGRLEERRKWKYGR